MSNANRGGVPYLLVLILLLIALAGGAAAGILGYIWITGGSGEASLSVEEALATLELSEDTMAAAVGTAIVEAAATVIPNAIADAFAQDTGLEAVADDVTTMVEEGVAAVVEAFMPASEPIEFRIVSAESRAAFTLEEDLRGVRTTVIGSTSEVGGSILVDLANPGNSSIGAIVINARTLETDNSFRNRALRSQILKSAQDEFEFIVFEARALSNWSAQSVALGESLNFDVTGDLTVAGVTRSVTFPATVTLDSETQISGSASVNLLHADFGLVIPDVPSVANVTDDVTLSLEFVARTG
ncbi:MAG: YceI family protein [Chloroflexi bacterium]|nr:YceI family protein [Chloroflexota bacterium]